MKITVKSFEQGVIYFKEGKFKEALEIINGCIVDDANNNEFYFFRARVLSRMGNFTASLADFDQLVDSEPYNTTYISDRAVVLHLLNRNQEALSELDRALNLDPSNPYRYSSRAYLKDRIGDLEGAIEDYEKAIELDPEDAVAYNNKGLVEEKMGYRDLSSESFEKADSLVGDKPSTNDTSKENPSPDDSTDQRQDIFPQNVSESKSAKVSAQSYLSTLTRIFSDKKTRNEFFSFIQSGFKKK